MARSSNPDVLLLAAAADPSRLAMLRQLADHGPICACDLDGGRAISQPTVSHHLKVLREAGWIVGERRGTWIWYSLRPEAAARFRQLAATFDAADLSREGPLATAGLRLPVLLSAMPEG
jgi:ArsR family transcriptional regulator, arsenate/arsenite/antimonite-responsive transcriptional repressor